MSRLPALGLLLALAPPLAAQPPIPPAVVATDPPAAKAPRVPGPIKAKVGELVTFEVSGDAVGYQPGFDPADCLLVRLHTDDAKTLSFLAQPKRAGRFGVALWEVGEKRGVTLVIDATGDAPPAPPPNPDPPKPPPVNPYRLALKAAFDADPGEPAAKTDVRTKLVELYSLGATMASDPAVTTTDVLRERLRRAGSTLAGDQLVGTRTAIANLLAPVLPLGQPLDADRRRAAAELFRGISEALAW
jgi:hypothetical protein